MINLKGSEIKLTGPLFTKDVHREMRIEAGKMVEAMAKQGADLVRGNLAAGIKTWTGETARGVEGFSYRYGEYREGSYYGKVRMAPDLPPRGGGKNAARVPYIINRVLETGHYGGTVGLQVRVSGAGKSRVRTRWSAGTGNRRVALHQFAKAARKMRAVLRDLTKGLT